MTAMTDYSHTETTEQAYVLNQIQEASARLRTGAAYLARRLEDTTARLDAGHHVNALGELQRAAVEFDADCGKREAMCEVAKMMRCDGDAIDLAAKGEGTFFVGGIR